MAQLVKNPPAMWETWVCSVDWDDPPEKGKVTYPLHYSGLEDSQDCIVEHKLSDLHSHTSIEKKDLLS